MCPDSSCVVMTPVLSSYVLTRHTCTCTVHVYVCEVTDLATDGFSSCCLIFRHFNPFMCLLLLLSLILIQLVGVLDFKPLLPRVSSYQESDRDLVLSLSVSTEHAL